MARRQRHPADQFDVHARAMQESLVPIPVLRVVARRIRRTSETSRGRLVLPHDAPVVTIPGPDPHRVLLVGSGPATGVGVRTHSEALTGALARRLAVLSGRGAVVESLGIVSSRLEDVPGLLASATTGRFDAVVVTAGIMEAVDLTTDRVWERWLLAVMEMAQSRFGSDTVVVLSGMPAPTGALLAGVGRRGWFIDRRATELNRTSLRVTAKDDRWHFAQLSSSPHVDGQPTADVYAEWAENIGGILARALDAAQV